MVKRKINWHVAALSLLLFFGALFNSASLVQAVCGSTPDPSLGTDTQTINVTNPGTYYLWARLLAPDTTNNSVYLQVDGNCALDVGDSSSIPANSWTWVNYQNGSSNSVISMNLTAGSHQVVMTGREPSVGVDRLLFLSDGSCKPTGAGDNCTPANDTTNPTVSITAPQNGSSVSGTYNVAANASDNVAVASVQFQLDGTNLGSPDTTSPYSYSWDTTKTSNGSHMLTAIATDTSGNTANSSVTVNINNKTADTTPPIVSMTTPNNGATVSGTSTVVSANATDNVGVAGVQFELDGNKLGSPQTKPASGSTYSYVWNTTSSQDGNHTLTAVATDAAGNSTTATSIKVTVDNSGNSGGNSTTVQNLSFSSSDNSLHWTGYQGASSYTIAEIHGVNLPPTDPNYRHTNYAWPHVTATSCQPGATCGDPIHLPAPSPGETVNFGIVPLDGSGNTMPGATWAKEITVTWPKTGAKDTTPPSQPINLAAAAASSSQINLSWTASTDNVGVTGYEIYRSTGNGNASLAATVNGNSYGDTGLQADTTYSYYVKAFDAAGNKSTASATASAKTQPQSSNQTATLKGVVYDSSTHTGINHVYVHSGGRGTASGAAIAYTDSSGGYVLANIIPNKNHTYYYQIKGYKNQHHAWSFPVGINTKDISLTPNRK